MGPIVLGVIAAIAFGTLYPFQLHCPGSVAAAFAHFQPAWPLSSGRGDIVANLILYIPLGLAVVAWQQGRSVGLRVSAAIAIGLGLSIGLELIQACEAARVSSWDDVCLNTLGVAGGAIAGVMAGRRLQPTLPGLHQGDIGAALLLALFAAWRLVPYVPTIDWQKWKNALKPLLFGHLPSTLDVLRHAVLWLVVARLVQTVLPLRRPAAAFLILFAGYFALRVMIIGSAVVPAELAGVGLGLIVTLLIGRRLPDLAMAALLAGAIAYQDLQPWRLAASAAPFCWVPFCGLLHGSLLINVASIAEKLFLYGALVWLLVRGGLSHRFAGILVALPLLAVEVIQTRLPGRVAEITDPLLALAVAETLRLIDRRQGAVAARR